MEFDQNQSTNQKAQIDYFVSLAGNQNFLILIERSLKIEQDFEVAGPCKCDDFWHDASKIIDFSRAQGCHSSDPSNHLGQRRK